MIFLIFLGITFFIQLLAAPWYDLASKTRCKKEIFKYKMLCSLIYIADLLLCAAVNKPFKEFYFATLFSGYIYFFISDILKEKLPKKGAETSTVLKALAFFLLSASFILRFFKNFPITAHNYIVYIVFTVFFLIFALFIFALTKVDLYNKWKLVCLLPLIFGAILLGTALQNTGIPKMQATSCALILGTAALSASTLTEIIPKYKNNTLVTTCFYYFGLMFTACSVI